MNTGFVVNELKSDFFANSHIKTMFDFVMFPCCGFPTDTSVIPLDVFIACTSPEFSKSDVNAVFSFGVVFFDIYDDETAKFCGVPFDGFIA